MTWGALSRCPSLFSHRHNAMTHGPPGCASRETEGSLGQSPDFGSKAHPSLTCRTMADVTNPPASDPKGASTETWRADGLHRSCQRAASRR